MTTCTTHAFEGRAQLLAKLVQRLRGYAHYPANRAYPKVKPSYATRARYRDPDAVTGGTWEALERLLRQAGYFQGRGRFPKTEVALAVGPYLDPDRNDSPSFRVFISGVRRLAGDLR